MKHAIQYFNNHDWNIFQLNRVLFVCETITKIQFIQYYLWIGRSGIKKLIYNGQYVATLAALLFTVINRPIQSHDIYIHTTCKQC